MSYTVLEGLALKIPIICSDRSFFQWVNNTASLIDPKDIQAIAAESIKILNGPNQYQKRSIKGFELIEENYSFDAMILRLKNLYAKTLK